jgi:transketolase
VPLVDSAANEPIRDYSIAELEERARYMRALNELALCSAGSGHSGGTLSIMDIAAALYLKVARHDPRDPFWPDRDRIIWSANHKAPALYVALSVSGYFHEKELMKLRKLGAPFQGHPHWHDLPGVEMSGGSLGQGISVAVGVALAAKLDGKPHRVFAISTDGEQQEGSVWEAAMCAAHHRLDNLIWIIDANGLQIDGAVREVMNIEPLADKYRAFGWETVEIDGHDMKQVVEALNRARNQNESGKPVVIIARTVKGKGISFMENQVAWHGKAPNRQQVEQVLTELGLATDLHIDRLMEIGQQYMQLVEAELRDGMPQFSRRYWWNETERMKVEMDPTRMGFGRALDKYGDDERVVCLGADISDSICISDFHKTHPERRSRFISIGIAEQNGTTIAAGLAREGKIPVFGTYGVFAAARNLDQIRISVCYANLNVLIVGAHGGVSVGPDGATHQELEALFAMCGLPNMHVGVPCDAIETEKMTKGLLFEVEGPKYLRFAREATPVVTHSDSPFRFGHANVHRLRREADRFVDAFDISLASEYTNEGEKLTIIACGPELAEALRAAYILKTECGVETRVLNMHTLKPLDREAIIRAAGETGVVLTAEEHQVGGLGNLVAAVILESRELTVKPRFGMVGVPDRFGESGQPWQLIKRFGLAAEQIAEQAMKLLEIE